MIHEFDLTGIIKRERRKGGKGSVSFSQEREYLVGSLWKNPKPSFFLPFYLPSCSLHSSIVTSHSCTPPPQEVESWWKEHVSRNRSHYRGFEADRNSNERKLETSVKIFILHCFSPVLSKKFFHAENLLPPRGCGVNSSPSLTKLAPPRSNLFFNERWYQFDTTMHGKEK